MKNREGEEREEKKRPRRNGEKGKNERWQLKGKKQGGGQEREYKKKNQTSTNMKM